MTEVWLALIQLLGLIVSLMLPVLVAYLIKKFKLEAENAESKRTEKLAVDIALGIEEWAATKKKLGESVTGAEKASRFIDQISAVVKGISMKDALNLSQVTVTKIGAGSLNNPT